MNDILFDHNYVATGDIIALALCVVVHFLIRSTYTIKRHNIRVFKTANRLVGVAAVASMTYHHFVIHLTAKNVYLLYAYRVLTYSALIWTCVCFAVYIKNLVEMKPQYVKVFHFSIIGVAIVFTLIEILGPVFKLGFYVDDALGIHQNYYTDIFRYAYVYYTLSIMAILFIYRKKFIAKMLRCIVNVMVISIAIMVYQAEFLQTSYTTVTFAFPIIAVLFLFHYNSYDVETGTLDQYAFNAYIEDMQGKEFSLIFLSMPEISPEKLRKMSAEFLRKNDTFFEGSCCFRLRDHRVVLAYQKEKNKGHKKIREFLAEDFKRINQRDKNDYRIVLVESTDMIHDGLEYLALCKYVEARMPVNSTKECTEEMVSAFRKSKFIYEHLKDISAEGSLEDERVKVYCQPVLNTKTNEFSTAEALMRLELPVVGLVFPDQFIPMAEQFGFIHGLSRIILHKTCKAIKTLENQGYKVERVSINFSVQELRLESFCDDVINIIQNNGVAFDKIAIEITESRNEKDFNNMKRVMETLKGYGIKFYLDDFGTGYSNFERIIDLPIDTIKFDRSLTILASRNDESRFMVGSFSEIFKNADYQILFEGVEDEHDEQQCKDMNALYLQGYKYSKPIPIEQLKDFLEK